MQYTWQLALVLVYFMVSCYIYYIHCTVNLPRKLLSFGDPDPAASSETNLRHTRPQLHLLAIQLTE